MSSENWVQVLLAQLWSLPYFIVGVVGLIVSLVLFPRCRLPAVLTALALMIMLVSMIGGVLMNVWIIAFREHGPRDPSTIFQIVAVARSLLGAVSIGLLVIAVFVGRAPRQDNYVESIRDSKIPPTRA